MKSYGSFATVVLFNFHCIAVVDLLHYFLVVQFALFHIIININTTNLYNIFTIVEVLIPYRPK